jgi:chitodextrinase
VKKSLILDPAQGTFLGSHAGKRQLAPGATYWLRLRERAAAGVWSAWTAWHAPFRTAP